MSAFKQYIESAPRVYEWVSDGQMSSVQTMGAHTKILVEVRGNDSAQPVKIYGSLHKEPAKMIGATSLVNDLIELPPVRFLSAEAAKGVSVLFMGVQ
jgi:hypothetical protein